MRFVIILTYVTVVDFLLNENGSNFFDKKKKKKTVLIWFR